MYVGVRPTDYSFPPLGANQTPPKRDALGACCSSCAKGSHNPPPMGADSMTGPMGDVVGFVTTPLGLILAAGVGYVLYKRHQNKKADRKWYAGLGGQIRTRIAIDDQNRRRADDLAAAAIAEAAPKRRRAKKRRRYARRRR